jgi:hypothetical protein
MSDLNRTHRRAIEKQMPKDASVLCAAIAERARLDEAKLKMAFLRMPEYLWPRKVREMREWVGAFDRGEIVRDPEAEE